MAVTDIDGPHAFHAFPSLPAELRCMIWRLAAFPRVVTLYQRDRQSYRIYQYDFRCDSIPAVLHACRESRREAPFVRALLALRDGGDARYIWLNYDLDTIRFVDNAVNFDSYKISDQDCAAMKSIILHLSEPEVDFQIFTIELEDLKRLPKLKSIQIHTAYGFQGWSYIVDYLERAFERWFKSRNDGWVCPDISLLDLETGFEVNRENQEAQRDQAPVGSPRTPRASGRGRGRGRGRGGRGGGH